MKTLTLKALDDTNILIKGCGYNQKLETISLDKIPGTIFISSDKTGIKIRIYCIYDDYEGAWVFALASAKISANAKPLDFIINQDWDVNNNTTLEIQIPEDSKIELEGQFSD